MTKRLRSESLPRSAESVSKPAAAKRRRTVPHIRAGLKEVAVYAPSRYLKAQAATVLDRYETYVDVNRAPTLWSTVLQNPAFWRHYGSLRNVGKVAATCREFRMATRVNDEMLRGLALGDRSEQPIYWLRAMLMIPSFTANQQKRAAVQDAIAFAIRKHSTMRRISLAKSKSMFLKKGPLMVVERVREIERLCWADWESIRHWYGQTFAVRYTRDGLDSSREHFLRCARWNIRRAKVKAWFPTLDTYPFGRYLLDWFLQQGDKVTDDDFKARTSRKIKEYDHMHLLVDAMDDNGLDPHHTALQVVQMVHSKTEPSAIKSFVDTPESQTVPAPAAVLELRNHLHAMDVKIKLVLDLFNLKKHTIPANWCVRKTLLTHIFNDEIGEVLENRIVWTILRRMRSTDFANRLKFEVETYPEWNLRAGLGFAKITIDHLLLQETSMLSFYVATPLPTLRPAVVQEIRETAYALKDRSLAISRHPGNRHVVELIKMLDKERNPLASYLVAPTRYNLDFVHQTCRCHGCFYKATRDCRSMKCFEHCCCVECTCSRFGLYGMRRTSAEALARAMAEHSLEFKMSNLALAFIENRITVSNPSIVAYEIAFREFYHRTTARPLPRSHGDMAALEQFRNEYASKMPVRWPWQDAEEPPIAHANYAGPESLRRTGYWWVQSMELAHPPQAQMLWHWPTNTRRLLDD